LEGVGAAGAFALVGVHRQDAVGDTEVAPGKLEPCEVELGAEFEGEPALLIGRVERKVCAHLASDGVGAVYHLVAAGVALALVAGGAGEGGAAAAALEAGAAHDGASERARAVRAAG